MTNLDPRREGRPRYHALTCNPDCIPPCHCSCDCHGPKDVAPQRETDK